MRKTAKDANKDVGKTIIHRPLARRFTEELTFLKLFLIKSHMKDNIEDFLKNSMTFFTLHVRFALSGKIAGAPIEN